MADSLPRAKPPVRVLAISGSLRRASINTAALEALARLAPEGVSVLVYRDLAKLPPFNPDEDVEDEPKPEPVETFRQLVGASDAIVIAAPEYAHGLPGPLKNALDWLVASVEFPGKAVALLNTSPRATHASAQLTEILKTMSARFLPEASVTLALPVRSDGEDLALNAEFSRTLSSALSALARAIRPE